MRIVLDGSPDQRRDLPETSTAPKEIRDAFASWNAAIDATRKAKRDLYDLDEGPAADRAVAADAEAVAAARAAGKADPPHRHVGEYEQRLKRARVDFQAAQI